MKHSIRILSAVLVLIILVFSATSCALNDLNAANHPSGGANTPSGNSSSGTSAVTIEEAVVFNQNGIKITAKSFDAKGGIFGPQIKMLIENDSEQSITVQVRDESVNGYMIGTSMSASVTPGKKTNHSLTIMRSDLEAAGITTIANVEFRFHIYNSETWDVILDSDPVRIETSAANGFIYSYDNSGFPAYNANGVEIVIKGVDKNGSSLGQTVLVYIYNYGDRDVTVQTRRESVNGFMVSGIFSCTVTAGKHAVDSIKFLSSSLEENGIETIENVELSFHISNADSWSTIVDTEPVSVDFN